jgi:hypothetical protein
MAANLLQIRDKVVANMWQTSCTHAANMQQIRSKQAAKMRERCGKLAAANLMLTLDKVAANTANLLQNCNKRAANDIILDALTWTTHISFHSFTVIHLGGMLFSASW